jgi:hypothetical protein
LEFLYQRSKKGVSCANQLLPVNSNETLLQELSISLLKNTRQIVFESSKILLSTVALESSLGVVGRISDHNELPKTFHVSSTVGTIIKDRLTRMNLHCPISEIEVTFQNKSTRTILV